MHVHRDAAEAFYVREGTYSIHLEGYVPPSVAHTFVVASDGPRKKLNWFSPASMVGFVEQLAEAEANGTTAERLDEISEPNHMGIPGAVPDTNL